MSEFLVNGQPFSLESGRKTWGDALDAVETLAVAEGRVVTAVRFAGVDQPSFREAVIQPLAVSGLGRVEIETVPRQRLLRTTLGIAGHSLPEIAGGARQAATAFRRGDETGGHRQLGTLVATVRTLLDLTLVSAAAAGATLAELPCGEDSAEGVLSAAGVVLDTLAQHQRAGDWIALADALEYDLAPAILEWGLVFDALQERCAA
ncbi:MAG: hypothetical protein AB7Q16_21535 [Vicinamibacterales bacterium]